MSIWDGLLTCWIGVCVLAQASFLVVSVRRLWRRRREPLPDAECPPALIVLCLRGGDPFLHRTLRRLCRQDYPDYQVRIVVDSAHDPAAEIVQDFLADERATHVTVQSLVQRLPTCTSKLSSLLQATEQLPAGTAFVAILDGDTVLHRHWLRELAAGIVRDGADVTTGNRWYVPEHNSITNFVRYWWNSSAFALMSLFHIPWGGTTAVRANVIQHPELRARLAHAFSDDTTIGQFVSERRGRIAFHPQLVINNSEDTSLRGFFNFEVRQLLTVRMQHGAWRWLSVHGILATIFLIFPIIRQLYEPAPALKLFFRGGVLLILATVLAQELLVRRQYRLRGESLPLWTPLRLVTAIAGLMLLPIIHVAAVLRAASTTTINWRGLVYQLHGTTPVELVSDLWRQPTIEPAHLRFPAIAATGVAANTALTPAPLTTIAERPDRVAG
ncbi:MAG: glycosyltransferase [Planctomycetaceae bacterium]